MSDLKCLKCGHQNHACDIVCDRCGYNLDVNVIPKLEDTCNNCTSHIAHIKHLRDVLKPLIFAMRCSEERKQHASGCHCPICIAEHALSVTSGYEEEK